MLERSKKEELVKEYNQIFSKISCGILIDYKGTTVLDITEARKKLWDKNSKIRILKNRIAKIATKGTSFELMAEYLIGTRALVYTFEDPLLLPKILLSDKEEKFQFVCGVLIDNDKAIFLDEKMARELSKIPAREQLVSQLLFLLQAPVTQLVRVLNELPTSLVRTLKAISDSKK